MEVRANYIIVGLFTILAILGILAFTLWIAKSDSRTSMQEYNISFDTSVSGLGINSDVLFSGIRVGQVSQITISPDVPGQVQVRVAIRKDTPVRADSVATLETRGLTGLSVVAISGGTANAPLVHLQSGEIGQIAYRASPFAAFMEYVPHTLESMAKILHKIDMILSPENMQALNDTLHALGTLSNTLDQRAENIDSILRNLDVSSKHLASISGNVDSLLRTDITEATKAMHNVAIRADKILASIEPGVSAFSKEGFSNLQMLLVESRNTISTINRIIQRIENDPRRFFFGESVQEFRP